MRERKSIFWERVKKVANSPAARKRAYTRRLSGSLGALFCFLFAIPVYIAEQYFGVVNYSLSLAAAITGLVLGLLIAQRKANILFKDDLTTNDRR